MLNDIFGFLGIFGVVRYKIFCQKPDMYSYRLDKIINEDQRLERIIDKKIENMRKQGIDTRSCIKYLNSIIDEHTSQLLNKLNREHADHLNSIDLLISNREKHKKELKLLKEEISSKIKEKEEMIELMIYIYNKSNPLSVLSNKFDKTSFDKELVSNEPTN